MAWSRSKDDLLVEMREEGITWEKLSFAFGCNTAFLNSKYKKLRSTTHRCYKIRGKVIPKDLKVRPCLGRGGDGCKGSFKTIPSRRLCPSCLSHANYLSEGCDGSLLNDPIRFTAGTSNNIQAHQ